MLEILDDRDGNRSTNITSQLPIDRWHEHVGDPTLADAIQKDFATPVGPGDQDVAPLQDVRGGRPDDATATGP